METLTNATNLMQPVVDAAPLVGPRCEAFRVKIGYIWLMMLATVAGLVAALVSLATSPSLPVLALAAGLLALGFWAWRQGYAAVRLELGPLSLLISPEGVGRPTEELPLPRIANYLRPAETYYQVLELQLHGGYQLRFSKRLRSPAAGLLALDDWTEQLALRLEQARSVKAIGAATIADSAEAGAPASGLAGTPPRILARTVFGKVLAGLAVVWLLLAALVLLAPRRARGGRGVSAAHSLLKLFFPGPPQRKAARAKRLGAHQHQGQLSYSQGKLGRRQPRLEQQLG